MKKKQVLFPISQIDTDLDFELLARFDEQNIAHLKDDYLNLPNNRIVPSLLRLEARPGIVDEPMKRRPYRAGIIAGSIILRARLRNIEVEPAAIFSRDVMDGVDWRQMRTARFALRQYFAEGIDVNHHLYQAVELPWALQNSRFVDPAARQHELSEDWMAVGLGDTLRLGELAYAKHTSEQAADPLVVEIVNQDLSTA